MGAKGFVDVEWPIVVVYGEGVVDVGLEVEFRLIGGKADGVGVMRRRIRVEVVEFFGFLHTSKAFSSMLFHITLFSSPSLLSLSC